MNSALLLSEKKNSKKDDYVKEVLIRQNLASHVASSQVRNFEVIMV